jgi:hypothetical protein
MIARIGITPPYINGSNLVTTSWVSDLLKYSSYLDDIMILDRLELGSQFVPFEHIGNLAHGWV